MVGEDHGLLVEPVVESRLVRHHTFPFLLQKLHILAPPLVVIREDQWISQIQLKKCNFQKILRVPSLPTLYSLVNTPKRLALIFLTYSFIHILNMGV